MERKLLFLPIGASHFCLSGAEGEANKRASASSRLTPHDNNVNAYVCVCGRDRHYFARRSPRTQHVFI